MSRPPGNADRLMISAGMELARKNGCSSLRIREVVDRAGVNLGMFHYHFKTRNRFTRLLLKEVYGEFFAEMTGISNDGTDSLEQFRASLILLARFLKHNRRIVIALFKDVLNGEPEVLKYTFKNKPPHIDLLEKLYDRCQEEGRLRRLDFRQVFPLFFGAFTQPLLMAEAAEKTGRKPPWFDFERAMSDEAVAERVNVVLRGIAPEPNAKARPRRKSK